MWQITFQLVIGTVVVMVGWWVVHAFNSRRDRSNKKRELLISYLIEAYRRLEHAAFAKEPENHKENVESAIADIQLFGSVRQVRLAQDFANKMAADGTAGLDHLLEELRVDLRKELNLEDAGKQLIIFRLQSLNVSVPNSSVNTDVACERGGAGYNEHLGCQCMPASRYSDGRTTT